jgi:hypothetical protein
VGGVAVHCETAQFEGTVEQKEAASQITKTEIQITPTYQGCELQGIGAATVKMNGCRYILRGTAELTAQTQIAGCTAGKKIEILTGACTITIGEQGELAHVTLTENQEQAQEKHHLQAHETLSGISTTRDGFLCPQGAASYSGTTTIKAYKDKENKEVTRTGHKTIEYVCGEEVGILAT